MEFNEKIKELRLLQNMTLEDVAKIVGVGKSTVRKWETGDIANVRRDKISKLAIALNTSPSYLMGWEDEPFIHRVPEELSLRGVEPGSAEFKNRLLRNAEYFGDLQKASPTSEDAGVDEDLIKLFMKLTPSEAEKVISFAQGLIAARE